MRLLRVLHLARVLARRIGDVFRAVELQRLLTRGVDAGLGQRRGVGTHVGNVTVFVQTLRHTHRALRGVMQLSARLLLQRGRHKRRVRPAGVRLLLHRRDLELRAREVRRQSFGELLIDDPNALRLLQLATVIEVPALRYALTINAGQGCDKFLRLVGISRSRTGVQSCGDIPVLSGDKRHALALTLDDDPRCHRLHTTCRQARHDLLPQHRGDLVAVKTVEDTATFLGINQVLVQLTSVGRGLQDGLLGDLMEHHAAHRHLGLQNLQQVPGNSLALTVGVRCEIEFVDLLELGLQVGDFLLLISADDIQRSESVVDIHAQTSPGLLLVTSRNVGCATGQVANVAHRRLHDVIIAEIRLNLASFRRRLDNYKALEAV